MNLTLDQLFQMEMEQLQQEHGRVPDPDSWRWSPFDIRKFDEMLRIAYGCYPDSSNVSFCEAGSGIGTKLYLAKNMYGMTEFGYEINDDYLEKARALGVLCEKRDLGDLDDQPVWAAYDIIYAARPFKDDMKESSWERLVMDDMRPGALWMSTYAAVKPLNWTCLYRGPFRGVWIKPDAPSYTEGDLMQKVSVP